MGGRAVVRAEATQRTAEWSPHPPPRTERFIFSTSSWESLYCKFLCGRTNCKHTQAKQKAGQEALLAHSHNDHLCDGRLLGYTPAGAWAYLVFGHVFFHDQVVGSFEIKPAPPRAAAEVVSGHPDTTLDWLVNLSALRGWARWGAHKPVAC